MLEIDGSYLEGGGQIFRNTISLSCILRRPVRVTKIRANRPNPGLNHQHLQCINLLQKITSAEVSGNKLKSTEVSFAPHAIKSGTYTAIADTASSISLMLQCALPVLAFADGSSILNLGGGTNVGMSPPVEYMTEIMRPLQELFGFTFDFTLMRRGYYPRGGGRCEIRMDAVQKLSAVKIVDFGEVREISGWCYVAGNVQEHVAEQMKQSAENALHEYRNLTDIIVYKETSKIAPHNSSGLVLQASTTSGCLLGSNALECKRSNPNDMGRLAANELLSYLKNRTCVDQWAQDQIIMYMGLAEGESSIKTCALTNHTRTAIFVAELILGVKFIISPTKNDGVMITCLGKGIVNNNLKTN